MISKSKNALIVWDRAGHYHLARYRNLAKKPIFFDQVYLANLGSSDTLYKWGGVDDSIIQLSKKGVDRTDLLNRLAKFRSVLRGKEISHVIISGYGRVDYILFIILSALNRKKVILFAESWYDKNAISRFIKRFFLQAFVSGLFVSGKRAYNHFKNEIGLKKLPIETGYSAVDNEHFASDTSAQRNEILCVARYSKEKNLKNLITAFRNSKAYADYKLQIIGDGPLRPYLEAEINLDNDKIMLETWKSYEELPNYYAKAKYFILPSTFEPWGLVVNEAMAAGRPVLLSEQCGCLPDFLSQEFGFVFDPNNVEDITNSINDALSLTTSDYKLQSEFMKNQVSKFDLDNWSEQLIKLASQC
ncbi:MAG: glycosyltransferase family 4 protein [Fulvivirga sp.]